MATLVFGAIGTLVAGPLGGAIGALAGRQIDRQIIGSPTREGPRLQDLKASTSSYGQPIAIHAGRMRTAGTIAWSTDLVEDSETGGGGKGQPKTKSYSYSISFAVLLASHPIDGVGRIWADGNLLRGAAGDLKTGGSLRVHTGHADQDPDPLLAAALGAQCPAMRGCAYVVFEALELSDFGNRLPALSFEVFAGPGTRLFERILAPVDCRADPDLAVDGLEGFTFEGGGIDHALNLLGEAAPLLADTAGDGLTIRATGRGQDEPATLGQAVAWSDGEFGGQQGIRRLHGGPADGPNSLRYYDVARDYQPSVQHAARRGANRPTLEFPAALSAAAARGIVRRISARSEAPAGVLYRVSEIDAAAMPGTVLRAPGLEGLWSVAAWEWREGGVELELRRFADSSVAAAVGDAGHAWSPPDRLAGATLLRSFALPWDGTGSPDEAQIYAAVGATDGRWGGAALYEDRAGSLAPLGISALRRAIGGTTESELAASASAQIESRASLVVRIDDTGALLPSTTRQGLASGDNRLLVGEEILQYRTAEALGEGRWRLTGLLRGRGGSEPQAMAGHAPGTPVTLLDENLVAVQPTAIAPIEPKLAAIDNSGAEPVSASVEVPGRTLQPPCPVHPRARRLADGSLALAWTRRARGAWRWPEAMEVPLVEQSERYEIGIGTVEAPLVLIEVAQSAATLAPATFQGVPVFSPVWVRQLGTHARSLPLLLTRI